MVELSPPDDNALGFTPAEARQLAGQTVATSMQATEQVAREGEYHAQTPDPGSTSADG